MNGKIIKIISNLYTVVCKSGEYTCTARGKFRNLSITPLVGDNVTINPDTKIIESIDKRKNSLIRPPIANVDQAIVVVSLKEPDLDLYLLDKLLCIIEFNNIKPIICFTKKDLLKDFSTYEEVFNYYKKIGYEVYDNKDLNIKKIFKDKITVIAGQSGAGKSTLLNIINPNLNLKTDKISKALGRGKHTTRHVELMHVEGGLCADTPGFSSLSLSSMNKSDIKDNFIEFNYYKEFCEYKDCSHIKEQNCKIKDLLGTTILSSRYDNYIKFLRGDKY